MRQSCANAGQLSGADRSGVAERVVEFIRAKFPVKTAESVAAELGVGSCAVQKWLDRSSAPSSWMLLKMISAFGPEFLAAVMGEAAPIWLRREAHEERRAQIEAQMAVLQKELKSL